MIAPRMGLGLSGAKVDLDPAADEMMVQHDAFELSALRSTTSRTARSG